LSIASEIISVVTTKQFNYLKISPKKITMPNFPIPTGYSLTKNFYPGYKDVLKYCKNIFNKNIKYNEFSDKNFHDVPHVRFKGPF